MSNKAHKCKFRLTYCPQRTIGGCTKCRKVAYNPQARFTSDDLHCLKLTHFYKIGDTIPDELPLDV